MTSTPAELAAIEAGIWRELQAALTQRGHAWRLAALASVAEDGSADARTVVLREVDAQAKRLVFFTAGDSAKVQQLLQRPIGTLLFWSAPLAWQLRLRAAFTVHTEGAQVDARQAALQARGEHALRDYIDAAGQSQFAVVQADTLSLDWLELKREGHRRAAFGPGTATWLQP